MAVICFPYRPAPEELEPGFLVTVTRSGRGEGAMSIASANNNIVDATASRDKYIKEMCAKGYRYQHRAGRHFLVKREGGLLPKTIRLQVQIEVNARALLQ